MEALSCCPCVCAESCQCVRRAASLLSPTGSYLGVQIQAGALLVCEGSGEGRRFKTVTVSYPQTPHCAALHCAARWPIFLPDNHSICLKLEGQLSKMITLCIKHAAASNFSFPSSVFSFLYPTSLVPSDPMGEEHHTWGTSRIFTLMVVVCIRRPSRSFSLLNRHAHTHAHVFQQLTFILYKYS